MRLILPVVLSATMFSAAPALAQNGPLDLKSLPAEIKSLKWKDIDFTAIPPLEQCRSLDLLNDSLDEIRAQMSADADLLSAYIEAKNLGPTFASQPPLQGPAPLTFQDGQRIAVALLRGPMAQSTYATELAGAPGDQLAAFQTMNLSSCQWKWNDMANSRLQVRSMAAFLTAQGKMDDFRAWIPGELARRAAERQAAIAQGQAAAAAQQQQRQAQAQQRQQQEEAQQQQQQQAALQLQQSMALQAQSQSPPAAPANNNPSYSDNGYNNIYYGGYAGLAAAAWYRNAGDRALANAAVDHRMAGWHGVGRR